MATAPAPRENPDLSQTGFQLGEVGRPLPSYDHHFSGVYDHPSNLKPVRLDTYDKVNLFELRMFHCFSSSIFFFYFFFFLIFIRSMVFGNVQHVTWMVPLTMVVIVYALMIAI